MRRREFLLGAAVLTLGALPAGCASGGDTVTVYKDAG
jgi:hypothetical protein